MAMSRKYYQETAAILRTEIEHWTGQPEATNALREVAGELASMFKRDNGRFDRSKFLEAAGLGE